MTNCGLCLAYNEDNRVIFRNEDAVSVVITNPLNEGHLLIMPRRHVLQLDDLTADESRAVNELLYQSQQRLADRFPQTPPVLGMNYGRHSTQPHIHYQLFPSDATLRKLYAAAHKPSELVSLPVDLALVRPDCTSESLDKMVAKLR